MASRVFVITNGRSVTLEGDDALVASFKLDGDDMSAQVTHAGGEGEALDERLALMLATFAYHQETPALFISQVAHMAQAAYEVFASGEGEAAPEVV